MRIAGKAHIDAETLDEADELGAALTESLGWINTVALSLPYAAQLRLVAVAYNVVESVSPSLAQRAEPLFEAAIEPIRFPGATTRSVVTAFGVVERRVDRMIRERRASGAASRRDLLSLLLAARDEEGRPMSDKQVRDEVVTLFVAGHETTANSLAWSLYLLGRDPAAYARARAEAAILGGRRATVADLPALPFCLQVFKEAMRLYPPIYFFGRQAIADVSVGGYDLPRGTVILISPYALHHRAALWPDPERFDPSRFEPAAEEARAPAGLHPLQRRPAHLHRQPLRADGRPHRPGHAAGPRRPVAGHLGPRRARPVGDPAPPGGRADAGQRPVRRAGVK